MKFHINNLHKILTQPCGLVIWNSNSNGRTVQTIYNFMFKFKVEIKYGERINLRDFYLTHDNAEHTKI